MNGLAMVGWVTPEFDVADAADGYAVAGSEARLSSALPSSGVDSSMVACVAARVGVDHMNGSGVARSPSWGKPSRTRSRMI